MYNLVFFNQKEFNTIEAFAAHIIPAGEDPKNDPGAKEVGSTEFIDLFMAQRDATAQASIKEALQNLNKESQEMFNNDFDKLSEQQQDELLSLFLNTKPIRADFRHLRKMALYAFHSNYTKEDYEGVRPWELTGYLGPVTYAHMTTEMINRHYQETQDDKTFVL